MLYDAADRDKNNLLPTSEKDLPTSKTLCPHLGKEMVIHSPIRSANINFIKHKNKPPPKKQTITH